jgi:hypothetical protein
MQEVLARPDHGHLPQKAPPRRATARCVGWSLCDRAEEAERHAKESSCSNPSGREAETTYTLAGEAASLRGSRFRWLALGE